MPGLYGFIVKASIEQLSNILCDLGPDLKVMVKLYIFLYNATSSKPLDEATSNFVCA